MDTGYATSYTTVGYDSLENIVRVLSSENSELHLKLFFQKDAERQQSATIDALRHEVAELTETVKVLQEKNGLADFVYLDVKCKLQDLEQKVSFGDVQKVEIQTLKDESAELSQKLRCQLELENELRGTVQELQKRVGFLVEGVVRLMMEREFLEREYLGQTEKMIAHDHKVEALKPRYAEKMAPEISVLKETLTKVRIEMDRVAEELERKVEDFVPLQEVAALKGCAIAPRDTNSLEDKCTGTDPVEIKVAEFVRLQEVAAHKACSSAPRDARTTFADKCTGTDPVEMKVAEFIRHQEVAAVKAGSNASSDARKTIEATCIATGPVEGNVEEFVRLQEAPVLNACTGAPSDTQETLEDKHADTDPVYTVNETPEVSKEEEDPVKDVPDTRHDEWDQFETRCAELRHAILHKMGQKVRSRRKALFLAQCEARNKTGSSKGKTTGKVASDATERP